MAQQLKQTPNKKIRLFKRYGLMMPPLIIGGIIMFNGLLGVVGCGNNKIASASSQMPVYNDTDYIAPGRGAEQWHDHNDVKLGIAGAPAQPLDRYWRFTWNHFELAKDVYSFAVIDTILNDCIRKNQKLSFGIMTCFPDGDGTSGVINFDNGAAAYPQYLHALMQSEKVSDWKSNGKGPTSGKGSWVPNWNSEYYLTRLTSLNDAINKHLESASYEGNRYKNVIGYIDIRGYGAWGEWHSAPLVASMEQYPKGAKASTESLKRIIDAHTQTFQDYPLVVLTGSFDADLLRNTKNAPEVAYYALTTRNRWGLLGWRRDSWGATDNYLHDYLENNSRSYNGTEFRDSIMERWKYAPIVGEPPGWSAPVNGCDYGDLENQVRLYHVSSFGNGNFGVTLTDCVIKNVRNASAASGYRLLIENTKLPQSIKSGAAFPIEVAWKNRGIAPTYENWDVYFELKNEKQVVAYSFKSSFRPKLFLPNEEATIVKESIAIPTLPAGNYSFNVIIKDPAGYRHPLPLFLNGRNTDGGFTLGALFISGK